MAVPEQGTGEEHAEFQANIETNYHHGGMQ
jgi:hypothetical protein